MGIEKKAAEVLLQKEVEVKIGNDTVKMPQPTLATLIMVSEVIPELPDLMKEQDKNMIDVLMSNIGKFKNIARVLAIFVLGAVRIKEGYDVPVVRKEMVKNRMFGIFKREKEVEKVEYIKELDYIEGLIIETMSTKEISMMLIECMSMVDVKDFFGITVSLSGANLLKSMEAVAIAPGD